MISSGRLVPAGWRVGTGAAAFAVAGLCAVSAQPARADWSSALAFTPDGADVEAPAVASNADGDAAIAWSDQVDSYDSTVLVAVRSGEGSFSAPLSLSAPADGQNTDPAIAVGADGTVAVLWSHAGSTAEVSFGSVAAGSFSAPVALDTPPDVTGPQYPYISIDDQGGVFAAWIEGDVLRDASRPAGAASFGPVGSVTSPSGSIVYPEYQSAPSGETIVSLGDAVVAVRPPGGSFGAAEAIGAPDGTQEDAVAIDDRGDAVVDWGTSADGESGAPATIHAAYRPAGGTFGPAETVAQTGGWSEAGNAVMTSSGVPTIAVLGVMTSPVQTEGITTLTRDPDGTWSPQVVYDTGGSPDAPLSEEPNDPPVLAYDAAGDLSVAWDSRVENPNTPQSGIYAETQTPGGTFDGAPVTVDQTDNPFASEPVLAASGSGSMIAVWSMGSSGNFLDGRWAQFSAGEAGSGPAGSPGAGASSASGATNPPSPGTSALPSPPPPAPGSGSVSSPTPPAPSLGTGATVDRASAIVRQDRLAIEIRGRAAGGLWARIRVIVGDRTVTRRRLQIKDGRYRGSLGISARRGVRCRVVVTIAYRDGHTTKLSRTLRIRARPTRPALSHPVGIAPMPSTQRAAAVIARRGPPTR